MIDSTRLIRPEHLNHHGDLFGGRLLEWADEHAYVAARRAYPGHRFVTVAMDQVSFQRPVHNGDLLRLSAEPAKRGTSSVRFRVRGHASGRDGIEREVFVTEVTLVSIGEDGKAQPIRSEA
jgi:acyl-CoA hydrolase